MIFPTKTKRRLLKIKAPDLRLWPELHKLPSQTHDVIPRTLLHVAVCNVVVPQPYRFVTLVHCVTPVGQSVAVLASPNPT